MDFYINPVVYSSLAVTTPIPSPRIADLQTLLQCLLLLPPPPLPLLTFTMQ